MKTPLAIVAYLLAIPLLGWAVLFFVLLAYKAYSGGLSVIQQVESQYWIRVVAATALGLLFLFLGSVLRPSKDSSEE